MSRKTKALETQINQLQEQLNSLVSAFNTETKSVEDASKDFAPTAVITKRAFLNSVQQAGMTEKGSDDIESLINEGSKEQLLQFWNHKLITDESFWILYWWEMNRFVDNWIAETSVFTEEDAVYEAVMKCFRYAFLFSSCCIDKDGNVYIVCCREDDKIYCREIEDMENTFTSPAQAMKYAQELIDKPSGGCIEFNKEDVAVLKLWWDDIGAYVKGIQYLAPYIYYRRIREKNVSFMHIIADTSTLGRKKPWWITMFNCFRIKDKSKDNQNRTDDQYASVKDKIKWYAPEETSKTYNTLSNIIDKQWQLFCSQFGIEVQAADQKQTLSTEADQASHYTLNVKKTILGRYYKFLAKVRSLIGSEFKFINDSGPLPKSYGNSNAAGGDKTIAKNNVVKEGGLAG